jgi:hypothetical protein
MPRVLEYIFGWEVFSFGVGLLLVAGTLLVADEFRKYTAGRVAFYLAGAWIIGKILMWSIFTSEKFIMRGILTFLVVGLVGVGISEAARLISQKQGTAEASAPQPAEPPKPPLVQQSTGPTKSNQSDTHQPPAPQKPAAAPPVQQTSQGANSPNTNTTITGNQNTVTNNITVNPPVPPKLAFKDETDVVSFSLGEHGVTFNTSIANLRQMPWQPFRIGGPGANSPSFSLMAEGDTLVVTASVGGGQFGPVIQVRNNVVSVREPSFDRNSNEHALEVVNADGKPVFQLIQKNPTHIIINGFFPVPNGRPIIAGPDGTTMAASDQDVANFHLKPIFKDPSWKYPGQYAD